MANRGQEIGLERQPAVTCVGRVELAQLGRATDRKSTRLNSSHGYISYAVFCLKKKIIVSREGNRNRRRLKANPTCPPFRVGIKSNIITSNNHMIIFFVMYIPLIALMTIPDPSI